MVTQDWVSPDLKWLDLEFEKWRVYLARWILIKHIVLPYVMLEEEIPASWRSFSNFTMLTCSRNIVINVALVSLLPFTVKKYQFAVMTGWLQVVG